MGDVVPLVSVIIPVYNNPDGLALCLAALENQTFQRDAYEILVVDNGSRGSIASVVSPFPRARVWKEPQPGSYAARNLGLRQAQGEVMAFTDSDCLPARDWIEKGVAELRLHPECGAVAGRIRVRPRDQARPTIVELFEAYTYLRQDDYVGRFKFGATANLFAWKETFDRVGPFDARLKSGGDLEWCHRAGATGRRVVYSEGACVDHPARRTLADLRGKSMRLIGAYFQLRRLHRDLYVRLGKGLIRDVLPPLRYLLAALRDPRPRKAGIGTKLMLLALYLWPLQVLEMLRLHLGAPVRR